MKADGTFTDCPGVMFDTGNDVATCISGELVAHLNLEHRIDHEDTRGYALAGRDDNGKSIGVESSTIKILIKIREMKFAVKALYDATDEETDLLIGRDIINQLLAGGFILGK